LSTWCVAAQVRAALSQAGFHLDKRPGFGRKREMLVGHAPGKSATAEPRERHALIVGAGLAGCATAERLATRGWQIDLIERNAEPSQEGSGNHAGIVRPLLARNDSIAARLNRACFLHTLRAWAALDGSAAPVRRGFNGVAHIARDADMAAQQAQMAADFPAEFAHFMRRDELAAKLGQPVLFGGLWFPLGGWAQPPSAARALRAACGERLRLHKHRAVAALHRVEGRWQARDANGAVIAQAPQLILATGAATAALDLTAGLPINRVRGQVSHLPAGSIPAIEAALCSEGYLTPAVDGIHCLGASYVHDDGCELRVSESAENLQRLARILPGAETRLDAAALAGRVGFRATTGDRLPLIGALPEAGLTADPGLPLADIPRLANAYALLGLGSRGLVWAMLAAETLASQIEAEPLPLEAELIAATDPARFLRQKKRR
jgi:tRNA 5-methylaminomethyl-2-thiouridine biosynthesis bifunctional protein